MEILFPAEKIEQLEFGKVQFFTHLDSNLTQTLNHPCVSVWATIVISNGDIVSGGSDGCIRIFTRSEERVADETLIQV